MVVPASLVHKSLEIHIFTGRAHDALREETEKRHELEKTGQLDDPMFLLIF